MSNQQVGNVYQQIIADVIESSRVDFEEGGVDEHVLEELRQGWQQKLSQLQVATFPWDPKPEPLPNIANPPTVPSNAGNYQMNTPPIPGQMPPGVMPPMPPMNNNVGPRIKSEPGLENSPVGVNQPSFNPPLIGGTPAEQRAAANLQATYGPRAAASINAIQGNTRPQGPNPPLNMQQQQHAMFQQQQNQQMQMQQQQQQQQMQQQDPRQQQVTLQMQQMHQRAAALQGMQGQQTQSPKPQMTQEQYKHAMAQQAAKQRQQIQNQNGVNGAQTDGAGDDLEESVDVIKRFSADGEEIVGRIEIDGLIRDKIAAMGQSMEGGGLMLPLHQATNSKKRQRKVKKSAPGLVPQHDGPATDDDEDSKDNVKDDEFDEDAINSDLDDPDDGLNEEEDDDDSMGPIMLCMYDKVQRVKNKWKCVMKDGVLTVNGKEYVFHKASGEYEW